MRHNEIKPAYKKNCLITADDWGFSPAVNRGILKLAKSGIVNRVSVIADAPLASLHFDELKAIASLEIGLHFNLTHETKHDSPMKLLLFTLNPLIPTRKKKEYIKAKLDEQISLLEKLQLDISHIDGHHHCHIFPYVASIVAETAKEHGINETRLPTNSSLWKTKRFLLPVLSIYARRVFKKYDLQYRPFFYPTLALLKNSKKLKAILNEKAGFEVIVHPAEEDELFLSGQLDKFDQQRVIEFHGLSTLTS